MRFYDTFLSAIGIFAIGAMGDKGSKQAVQDPCRLQANPANPLLPASDTVLEGDFNQTRAFFDDIFSSLWVTEQYVNHWKKDKALTKLVRDAKVWILISC